MNRLALLALVAVSLNTGHAAEPLTLFQNGNGGYNAYRIPALVRAANGDLLAFCEAREGGDASEIDLVLKRSTDHGATWGAMQVVQESDSFLKLYKENPPPISVGNPAPVVDLLDPQHPGRIWLPFTVENHFVFVTHSDDHGATWAEPRDITKDVKLDSWGWYATGPVHGIQLQHSQHKGRLVIPCDHRLGTGGDKGPCGMHAIYSDDHGQSWKLGAIDATYDDGLEANETTVVELGDGRLYFNSRDQNGKAPGTRGETYSTDGGATFEPSGEPGYQWLRPVSKVLDPPVVQCSLLRVSHGDSKSVVLFCGPDESGPTGKGRNDLRIRYSTDETKSWQDGPLIHTGPAAYSDLVQIDPDSDQIGILFEAGSLPGTKYDRIDFVVRSVTELTTP